MYLNVHSGFEVVQGILDLLMTKIGAQFSKDYYLRESDDPMYFPKRGANVFLKGVNIGSIGVMHPEVLEKHDLKFPVTCFELRVADLFDFFKFASE